MLNLSKIINFIRLLDKFRTVSWNSSMFWRTNCSFLKKKKNNFS